KGQVASEAGQTQISSPGRSLRKRGQLAREVQGVLQNGIEERFLTQPIACGEELIAPAIVDGKGEHPFDPVDAARAELPISVENGFGVARCSERVALRLEQCPQRAVVVDLAVEGDPARLVLVRDRLA